MSNLKVSYVNNWLDELIAYANDVEWSNDFRPHLSNELTKFKNELNWNDSEYNSGYNAGYEDARENFKFHAVNHLRYLGAKDVEITWKMD